MRKSVILILFIVFLLSIFSTSVYARIKYDLELVSSSNINLYTGQSTTVQISIKNNNLLSTGYCTIRVGSGLWSEYQKVGARSSAGFEVIINAPQEGSGSGTVQHTIYTNCYDTGDSTLVPSSRSVSVSYTENPIYISKTNAYNAIAFAEDALNSASSDIKSALNAINDAKSIGADVSSAEVKLTSAQASYQNAQSKLSSANSLYTTESYDPATTAANEAASYANAAYSDASSAVALANRAKQDQEKLQEQAVQKLASAQNTYNGVIELSEQSNKMMDRLSDMGVGTSNYEKELKKVTDTFLDAKAEIDKAKSRCDNREYENCITYSEKSLDISESAFTIIQNLQYNVVMDGMGVVDRLKSDVTSKYSSALKTLESTKSEMTADIYMSKSEELDDVKKTLDLAETKISSAESNLNSKNYYDALNGYRGAYSELKKVGSLSTNIEEEVDKEQKGICGPTGILLLILIPALGVNIMKKREFLLG